MEKVDQHGLAQPSTAISAIRTGQTSINGEVVQDQKAQNGCEHQKAPAQQEQFEIVLDDDNDKFDTVHIEEARVVQKFI